MYVLELIWDNLKNAVGDMLLWGTVSFILALCILIILNRIGGFKRRTISGKILSGFYYFFIPFVLSLGFALYGGVNGVRTEVIRDAHLSIDAAGKQSLGRFDNFLKEKGIEFNGHGYSNDSIARLFLSSVNIEKESWKGELIHWTVENTLDQVENRMVKEASGRSGIDENHISGATNYLENGAGGNEIGYLEELGTGIAKSLVEKKVNLWVKPYMYLILFFTLLIAGLPIMHCVLHAIIVRIKHKKNKKEVILDE